MIHVTWWGHATSTIEIHGTRVLTDPVLGGRLAHLRRVGGPLPDPDAARADVVAISHLHADHLHIPSLRVIPTSARLIAPRGAARVLARAAPGLLRQLEEVDAGDVRTIGGLRVRAVPAAHDGRRRPRSRHTAPALGYIFESSADCDVSIESVWFAGDTGLFDAMTDLGPVAVALVPVGGWGPTLGPDHLDPAQAAEAVRRVGARDAVPVHYGTFWPIGLRRLQPGSFRRRFADPGARFADELALAAPGARAHVLDFGTRAAIGEHDMSRLRNGAVMETALPLGCSAPYRA